MESFVVTKDEDSKRMSFAKRKKTCLSWLEGSVPSRRFAKFHTVPNIMLLGEGPMPYTALPHGTPIHDAPKSGLHGCVFFEGVMFFVVLRGSQEEKHVVGFTQKQTHTHTSTKASR